MSSVGRVGRTISRVPVKRSEWLGMQAHGDAARAPVDRTRRGGDESSDVSIAIPCLNGVETIGKCVRGALAALERRGYAGGVIGCDDGSPAGSVEDAGGVGAIGVYQPIQG